MAKDPETPMDPVVALMAQMLAIQQQQAAALTIQTDRTAPKENPNYVADSIFLQPSGEPWATTLKCQMYFGPFHLNQTPLTRPEVTALNRLQPIERATVSKSDGTLARVTVRPTLNAEGRIEQLTIEMPLRKEDNAQHYPSLVAFATEVADQSAAVAA